MHPYNETTALAEAPPSNSVDVVIVNWNAGLQLAECIASVEARDPDIVARLVVVDNGSVDGSEILSSTWNKILVDAAGRNLGFGRACNRGAAHGNAPLILLLNPDTRLTGPALSAAAGYLLDPSSSDYAICGIALRDDNGHVTRHCARFPTLATFARQILGLDKLFPALGRALLMEDFDHLSERDVDHVQGAFYMIRRDVFEELLGFDEDYFVYFEDLDLSLRAHQAGWRTRYLAKVEAFHRGGGTSSQVKARARFYGIEARLLYVHKHFGRTAKLMHTALTFLAEPPLTALWYWYRYGRAGLGAACEVTRLLYSNAPRLLRSKPATSVGPTVSDGRSNAPARD